MQAYYTLAQLNQLLHFHLNRLEQKLGDNDVDIQNICALIELIEDKIDEPKYEKEDEEATGDTKRGSGSMNDNNMASQDNVCFI